MSPKKAAPSASAHAVSGEPASVYKYPSKRKNIPPAGLAAQGALQEAPKLRYEYNPHLPPVLRSAGVSVTSAEERQRTAAVQDASRGSGASEGAPAFGLRQSSGAFVGDAASADHLPELLRLAKKRPLSDEEAKILAAALLKHEPWLEWSGKREKPWFEVEPVALHIHERVSTQAILRVLARQDVQRDLFADPQQSYADAVQFYKFDVDWANRLILGDSLQVMASLARREDLAGKVQMIYFDPPYGIKFSSNFQPQLGQRDVKDREQDLTREPEMVKAYRDTWTLGIHSYLAYLRDRLAMARELLTDTGSLFVQISDENLHRVRCVMDEVFKVENFAGQIAFKKTGGFETIGLPGICDYLLWYAKDKSKAKFITLFDQKVHGEGAGDRYNSVMLADGSVVPASRFATEDGLQLPKDSRLFLGGPLTSDGASKEAKPFEFQGESFLHKPNQHWKTTIEGLGRVGKADRIFRTKEFLNSRLFLNDFIATPVTNMWTDTMGTAERDKVYIVQTTTKIIERCLLMTTDPGDLVLDPTCGSGTTAFVAEQWGRRWIAVDTSRVALALAKQRLLTARFSFYQLRPLSAEDVSRNPHGTWLSFETGGKIPRASVLDCGSPLPLSHASPPLKAPEDWRSPKPHGTSMPVRYEEKMTFACKTVPHITLKSIARNTSLDPIFAQHEMILAEKLAALNAALRKHVTPELWQKLSGKLFEKQQRDGKKSITEADRRRWILPTGLEARPSSAALDTPPVQKRQRTGAVQDAVATNDTHEWREWEAPFDTDPDWPKPLQEALLDYRKAWRAKMDAVNECISANAEMEELVDKPEEVRGVVRVSGPFTVEGVIALEDGPDTPIGGAPGEMEAFLSDMSSLPSASPESQSLLTSAATEVQNIEAHLDKVVRLLKASGVDFPGNKNMKFSRLDPITGASLLHAEGEWVNGDQKQRRVAVSIGPEVGNLTAYQVEDVIRDANRKGYDDVVFAAFGFDAAAQDAIEGGSHPKVRLHMALIRPDVAMGDLLKTQPGSQLFTVFSAPRVKGPTKQSDGMYLVEVEGMDVYDPVSNTLFPTNKERIAAWWLDSDYDGRTFCICQAFFPDKSKWEKLAKALGDKGVIEEEKFAALSGLKSLPFPRPARLKKGEIFRVAVKVIDPRGNEGMRVLEVGGEK